MGDSLLRILRPVNCTMAGIAVFAGAVIAGADLLYGDVLLAGVAAFLICGAGNTINDYFDHEIDSINNPLRPIPSGEVSLDTAKKLAAALFGAGVLLAAFISQLAVILAFFNSALLYLYAWKLKKRGFIGNVSVSYLVASPILFGGVAAGNPLATLILALCASLANVGREIAKDIEDVHGDKGFARTLPIDIGIVNSARVAVMFLLLAILVSPLPYLMKLMNLPYLVVVIIADVVFLHAGVKLLMDVSIEIAGVAQRRMKLAMAIALVAFLVGSI